MWESFSLQFFVVNIGLSLVHNMALALLASYCCENHGKNYFFTSQIISLMLNFFDNLIGWMLANAGNATLE